MTGITVNNTVYLLPTSSSQIDLHWASPQRICGPFLEFIHVLRFCQPACFFDLHWDSSKLPWGMQRICGPFVLKTIIMPFKRIFDLWHSLIRSLYFIWVYIFIPVIHSAPFLRFSHIFHILSLMTLCSELNYYFWFQQLKASFELYFSFYRL